jgi:RNA polymerase sigma factor (sigma-70 family)
MSNNDAEITTLWQGCTEKRPDAQRALVQRFAPGLLSVARRYARNRAEAEDILQDSFILIFEKIGSYDATRGSLPGWLRKVVINTAISHYRKFHFTHERPSEILPDNTDQTPGVIQQLSFDELLELVNTLPDGLKTVFNMAVFDDYSHDEIGELLQMPAGTSRSILSRARKILQEKINARQQYELARLGK